MRRTCRLFQSVKPINLPLHHLLQAVSWGQRATVKNILKENTSLLHQSGFVTDYAGVTFHHVTPFQLAAYYYDIAMCEIISEYLEPDVLSAQVDQLSINKLAFTRSYDYHPLPTYFFASHFDAEPLLDHMKNLIDRFKTYSEAERKKAFLTMGKLQQQLPPHMARWYCCPKSSLAMYLPSLDLDEEDEPIQNKFFIKIRDHSNSICSWYNQSVLSAETRPVPQRKLLGVDVAALKLGGTPAFAISQPLLFILRRDFDALHMAYACLESYYKKRFFCRPNHNDKNWLSKTL